MVSFAAFAVAFARLRSDMHAGFDRLDARFDWLFDRLDARFEQLEPGSMTSSWHSDAAGTRQRQRTQTAITDSP